MIFSLPSSTLIHQTWSQCHMFHVENEFENTLFKAQV